MLTICRVLQHQFYTRRVKVQLCLIITACKCEYTVQIDWFWLLQNMLWSKSLVLNASKHTGDTQKCDFDVKKNANKPHSALFKNLNCEKNDSLIYTFYFVFLLPIVAIKHKKIRVGHRANFWANRLFVAKRTLIIWRFRCHSWTCLSQTINLFAWLVQKSNTFK